MWTPLLEHNSHPAGKAGILLLSCTHWISSAGTQCLDGHSSACCKHQTSRVLIDKKGINRHYNLIWKLVRWLWLPAFYLERYALPRAAAFTAVISIVRKITMWKPIRSGQQCRQRSISGCALWPCPALQVEPTQTQPWGIESCPKEHTAGSDSHTHGTKCCSPFVFQVPDKECRTAQVSREKFKEALKTFFIYLSDVLPEEKDCI